MIGWFLDAFSKNKNFKIRGARDNRSFNELNREAFCQPLNNFFRFINDIPEAIFYERFVDDGPAVIQHICHVCTKYNVIFVTARTDYMCSDDETVFSPVMTDHQESKAARFETPRGRRFSFC